jgi:GR25 family glycosyltransferase involved in LPS biosynthesis
MLLINRISLEQLVDYRKNVIKCLKDNIKNPYIKEILVFLEIIDNNLPKNNKIKYITKNRYSDKDIIEYSKKISYEENILFSKSTYSFTYDLRFINTSGNKFIENENFIFFKRDYNLYDNFLFSNKKLDINKKKQAKNKQKGKKIKNIPKSIPKLDVVIASINYNEYLSLTLEQNIKIFENITVVTIEEDKECQEICKNFGVSCIVSKDIIKDGKINKSKCLNKGIESLENPDWILILDADIVVNEEIDINGLKINTLYTSERWITDTIESYIKYTRGEIGLKDFKFENDKGIGFFQLFNYKLKSRYPDSNWGRYSESTWADVTFKRGFKNRESLGSGVIHIGKPYQKWNTYTSNNKENNNTLKISKRDPNIKPKLAVLTTFFNPKNYINLRYNYLKFSEKIKEKADLFPIELSFNDDFFIEYENVIQIKGTEENILWQKERLLNIALENLPKEYTNVAWVDCDVIFENENWVEEVNEKLKDYKVLHLFENAKRLDENGNIDRISKSIIENIKESNKIPTNLNKGITGFGWAIRREDIEKIKFLDTQIIGGADSLMFFSFVGLNNTAFHKKMNNEWLDFYNKWNQISFSNIHSSINNISGDIIHLYHGKMINRNYNSRYEILSKERFNPILDLIIDNNNLWKFKNVNISKNLEKYFESRDEDDNVININKYFDNIYVLNLDRRPDRYENIKYNLDKLDIKVERFSAIDGDDIKDDEYNFSNFKQGYGMIENKYALGCLRSHIEIIKDAKSKGYKRILIFEDDVLINSDIKIHFQKIRNIDNWKLLYLGASQYNWDIDFIEDFYYSRKTLGCFAYAIDESMYDEILETNKEELSIDNLLLILQSKYYKQCYTFYPNICIADVSESTIRAERDQDSHSKRMKWNLLKNYI